MTHVALFAAMLWVSLMVAGTLAGISDGAAIQLRGTWT